MANDLQLKSIADEYRVFVDLARKMASEDEKSLIADHKANKKFGWFDHNQLETKHILDMIEMFNIKYNSDGTNYQMAWKEINQFLDGLLLGELSKEVRDILIRISDQMKIIEMDNKIGKVGELMMSLSEKGKS